MVGGADEQVAGGIVGKRIGVRGGAGESAVDIDPQFRRGEDHGHMVPPSEDEGEGGIEPRLDSVGQHAAEPPAGPHLQVIGLVVVEGGVALVDDHREGLGELAHPDPGRHGELVGFEGGGAGHPDIVVDAVEPHGAAGDAVGDPHGAMDGAVVAARAGIEHG